MKQLIVPGLITLVGTLLAPLIPFLMADKGKVRATLAYAPLVLSNDTAALIASARKPGDPALDGYYMLILENIGDAPIKKVQIKLLPGTQLASYQEDFNVPERHTLTKPTIVKNSAPLEVNQKFSVVGWVTQRLHRRHFDQVTVIADNGPAAIDVLWPASRFGDLAGRSLYWVRTNFKSILVVFAWIMLFAYAIYSHRSLKKQMANSIPPSKSIKSSKYASK